MIKLRYIIFLAVLAAFSAADDENVRNKRDTTRYLTPLILSVLGICFRSSPMQQLLTHTMYSDCSSETKSSHSPFIVFKAKKKDGRQPKPDQIKAELTEHMDNLYFEAYALRYTAFTNLHSPEVYCIPRLAAATRDLRQIRVKRGFEEEFLGEFPLASFEYLATDYISRANIAANREYQLQAPPAGSPYRTVVTRGPNNLPVLIQATIRHEHLPRTGQRPRIPANVYERLERILESTHSDDAGHLLAYSLGGGMDNEFNYAPQTRILNRNEGQSYSLWRAIERSLAEFLRCESDGHIDWQLLVIYDTDGTTNRPVGFCLQHENFNNAGQSVSGRYDWCFSNNPNDECAFARNPFG